MGEGAGHQGQRDHELATIRELTDFLAIDESARIQAARIWDIIQPKLDSIIASFFERVAGAPVGIPFDAAMMMRLKVGLREHLQELFGSRFDEVYLHSATRVGIRHRGLGLDPKWYVAGYTAIKLEFNMAIMRTPMSLTEKAGLIETLDRYVAVDMGLALSTYSAAIVD